ncbi:MAG: magnesium transporter [Dehalococcoidales bacterium]|nr:magnesium transporter [Dehalococcoidales bacterium]
MKDKQKIQDESSSQNGTLIDEEKTEDIAEQIQDLVEKDNQPAAIKLFSQLRPGDQGEVMEDLPLDTQQEILTALPPEEAAEILEHLEPKDAAEVIEGVDSSVLSDILDEADSDVAADILRQLPEEHALDVIGEMEEAAEVIPVLQYADDTAGGRMVVEYVSVKDDATAADALEMLRQQEPEQVKDIRSVFVTDAEGRLAGELSIARLALAKPKTMVRNIMETDIVSVKVDTNQEECARVMERYNIDELPVVDAVGHLVGVIMSEDIIDVIEEEATEDIYKMAGIPGERVFGSLFLSMRNRLPWLSINLVTTFLAALVISIFESTIAQLVTLAVFLPIVAGQGGIGGTQTLTLVVRSIALGEISKKGGFRLLRREVTLGLIHGLLLGVVVGLIAYIWKGNYMLGLVLGMAMVGNMIIAGLSGAGIPLILTRLRVDPAVASAVIVTTCTDVIGFFLFLGLATALVTFLV